jgi:hypothetical protein
MPKIKLNVDTLRVESFDTAVEPSARGTVHARQDVGSNYCASWWHTCAGDYCTWATLCLGSCQSECAADTGIGPVEIG